MRNLIVVVVLIVSLAGVSLAQGGTWAWIIPETWLCVFDLCPGTVQPLIEDVPVPAEFVGQANATTYQADGPLTLGEDVDIYIHMGQDGRWSAELDMEFICLDGGPTPTPSNTPSPTATPTATAPGPTPTVTSTPAPTSVDLSGISGQSSGPSPWLISAVVFAAGLFVWTVRKREGE